MSRSIREIPIGEHTDPDILALLAELEHAAGVDTSSVKSQPFIPFLMLAVHPQGGGTKREPLHPSRTHPGFLETRIGRIVTFWQRFLSSLGSKELPGFRLQRR
jgi:hypothetical protein